MSGFNANGYGEARRYLLGIGDLYFNNEFVGNLKGSVTMNHTREFAYQKAGNNLAHQKIEVTAEEATIEAEICDFKIAQLRRAFGVNQAIQTAASKTLHGREVIQLNGTTAVTLSNASASNVVVSKLDRSKIYALTTDYTFATNQVTRVALGAIADGEYVIAEYDYADSSADAIAIGGETKTPPSFELIYTFKDSTGKMIQVKFFKAVAITEFEMAFNERESGDYTVHPIKFKALVDVTKPEGQNLLEIVQEDAA